MEKLIEKLKKLLGLSKKSAGFTLIELLVVIGILGVLAAALVATIDPFEQLKKATDTNVKNTAVEFTTANIRYYTTHNNMPWVNDAAGCGAQAGALSTTPVNLTAITSCLADLIADGELKPGFTSVTNILNRIFISGTATTVVACFNPLSKAQNHDADTKYTNAGVPQSPPCPATSGISTSCFWCAQ